MKNSNPKAIVDIKIDNELQYPKIEIVYGKCTSCWLRIANDYKSTMIPTNLSFKKILHNIQDELLQVGEQMDIKNFDAFRKQEHTYIMSEIKKWEDKHKEMIKEMQQK